MQRALGKDSETLRNFRDLSYYIGIYSVAPGEAERDAQYFAEQVGNAVGFIDAAIYQLELQDGPDEEAPAVTSPAPAGPIFVVHGHDDARKYELMRLLGYSAPLPSTSTRSTARWPGSASASRDLSADSRLPGSLVKTTTLRRYPAGRGWHRAGRGNRAPRPTGGSPGRCRNRGAQRASPFPVPVLNHAQVGPARLKLEGKLLIFLPWIWRWQTQRLGCPPGEGAERGHVDSTGRPDPERAHDHVVADRPCRRAPVPLDRRLLQLQQMRQARA